MAHPQCAGRHSSPNDRFEAITDDSERSKWQHLVEHVFCNLKPVRRIAMRFEKTDVSDAAMIEAVSACLALA